MIPDKDKLFSELNALGEKSVREKLAQRVYHKDKVPLIQEWLKSLVSSRSEETLLRQAARELEANSIAREANSIARSASERAEEAIRIARDERNISIVALIISIIAIIISIILK